MEETYTIRVEVTDSTGNSLFSMKTEGSKSDIFEPEAATPGTKPVLAYLTKVAG
jgi:hypothetical protein